MDHQENKLDFIFNNNIKVKISIKSLKQEFNPCTPAYINDVCKGRCCEGSSGLMVTIHETEIDKYKKFGIKIKDNFIVSDNNKCPFKINNLCSIHNDKPFGCKASPFTLSKNDVLIVRNRYRLLKCYKNKTEKSKPVYIVHRWSLEQIFGKNEVDKLIKYIESGKQNIYLSLSKEKYYMLKDNDKYKRIKK